MLLDFLPLALVVLAVVGYGLWRGIHESRELREHPERGPAGRWRSRGAPSIREDSAGADDFGDGGEA